MAKLDTKYHISDFPLRVHNMAPKDFHHPFEPYDIQCQFMEALYQCIEQGNVGIFESPTGTGKSLSLICGSTTWLREHKRRTFDEALAALEIDDDEPEWMVRHAREARSREMRQMRADLEARLDKVRERERRVRERLAHGEPANKRQKQSHPITDADADEEQFLLDDYNSDDEGKAPSVFSTATTKVMERLGLLPKRDDDGKAEDEVDELKIYFCSRTHSQLSQFIGELRRVKLPPGLPPDVGNNEPEAQHHEELKHLTLGSRRNLCINPKVTKLSSQAAINERCVELQQTSTSKDKKCPFVPSKDTEDLVLDFRDHALARVRDIEDLATLGSKLQICPYYSSRPAIGLAEIVTLPYPLLLQKSARKALGLSLKNHVIIIDEAHNLINAVEGTYSAQVSDSHLQQAKDGLIVYLQKFRNRLKGSNRSYVTQVVRVIDSLLQFANSNKETKSVGNMTTPSALLAGKAVDQINLAKLVRYITESKLARKVEGYAHYNACSGTASKQKAIGVEEDKPETPALTHVHNFLMTLMNPAREGQFFWAKEESGVVLRYMLLDPSEHFRDIVEEARSVVLAGGTMSPMDDYKQELFPYLDSITTFSCGHLIPTSSLFVRAITSDTEGRIDFSFKSRNFHNTMRLGNALLQIVGKVSNGVVVFFPSYGYLSNVLETWKSEPLFSRLQAEKPIFSDSRSVAAEDTFRAYSEAVRSDDRGALLLSVIGGKLSEGINFSDELGRCVVVVGLPYPNLETPEWKAKMQYLDERAVARGEMKGKASREHAENVCMRSVNQAIGRAIRHKNDWASILLFDARYGETRVHAKLPGWIKSSFDAETVGGLESVVNDLEQFFKQREN